MRQKGPHHPAEVPSSNRPPELLLLNASALHDYQGMSVTTDRWRNCSGTLTIPAVSNQSGRPIRILRYEFEITRIEEFLKMAMKPNQSVPPCVPSQRPTIRWTGAAVACFLSCAVLSTDSLIAPPGQLHRYASIRRGAIVEAPKITVNMNQSRSPNFNRAYNRRKTP